MRILLLVFTAIVAITALCAGILLVYAPDGSLLSLSPLMLENTPFRDYLLPGLVMLVLVGGSNFIALMLTAGKQPSSYRLTLFSGFLLVGWVVLQLLLMQYFHWVQLLLLVLGLLIVLLSYHMMGKAAF